MYHYIYNESFILHIDLVLMSITGDQVLFKGVRLPNNKVQQQQQK